MKNVLPKKENKGITLVSLVVTIIVLLILAGVSISMLFGENGILKNAENAKVETQKGEYQEKINLAVTEANISKKQLSDLEILKEVKTTLEKDSKFKEAVITGPDENKEKLKLTVVTKEGYVYYVYGDQVVEQKEGTEDKELDINIQSGDIKYTYYYGNSDVIVQEGKMTNSEVRVKIEISNENYKQYQIEYSYDAINWTIYKEELMITENNTKIYARLTNGIASTTGNTTGNVTCIDRLAPNEFEPEVESTTNSIKVIVKTTDKEATEKDGISGIIGYRFSIDNGTTWTDYQESGEYTFGNLTQTTDYTITVETKDGAENTTIGQITKGTGTVTSGLIEGAITFSTPTWSEGKASTTISTNTEYTIQYQVNSVEEDGWVEGTSVTGLLHGDMVHARLWDGTNGGEHATHIVHDGTAPSSPTITVTSGTVGQNSWYTTNVVVKITAGTDGESGVDKTTYTLSGATTKAETTITSGSTITISAEGTTTVTAYTYDVAGNKSAVKTLTIKKDSVAPTITLNQANVSTREYSKQINVTVTDSISQVQTKKYAYASRNVSYFASSGNNLGTSFTARTSDGETYTSSGKAPSTIYTVYAKDNAGNQTVKTINIQNLLIFNTVTAKNGLCTHQGGSYNSSTGVITLPTGSSACQYGPYWNLPEGTYEITYTGSNLPTDMGQYLSYITGGDTLSPVMQSANSNKVVYRVTLPNTTGTAEFVIYNGTSNVITINNITVKQL